MLQAPLTSAFNIFSNLDLYKPLYILLPENLYFSLLSGLYLGSLSLSKKLDLLVYDSSCSTS